MDSIQKHTLPNGLTVLLQPLPQSELSCVLTWVKVGYFDEPDHLTGISHVIEHMYFKGTKRRGVGQIAQETKELGGYLNAGTIYEHTSYHVVAPSEKTVAALDIQADALIHSVFDAEELQREKAVICQEIKRKFDNPHALASEKLLELSFQQHPIRRWRIGTEEQVMGFTREQIVDFYSTYYVPENIILTVAGNFKPEQMLEEIRERYMVMPARKVPTRRPLIENADFAPRLRRMKGDVSRVLVKMGFQAPSLVDPAYYATSVLNILIGKGKSSRFYRNLKEEKGIVDGVGTSYSAFGSTGFFSLDAEVKEENISICEEELWNEVLRLMKDPPSEAEIKKISRIVESNFYREKEDVMGQAYSLAYFEQFGGYEKLAEYTQKIREVTSDQVVAAAQNIFRFEKMSLMEYVPQSLSEGAKPERRLESLEKRVTPKLSEFLNSKAAMVDAPTPSLLTHDLRSVVVSADPTVDLFGAYGRYIWFRNSNLPLVSICIQFPGGRLNETKTNSGITNFVLKNTVKGTEHRTADEIAFSLESLGAGLSYDASADHFGFTLSLLAEDFEKGVEILADIMGAPLFLAKEIEKEKGFTQAMLKRLKDDMFRYPVELFYQGLFGSHPYGFPRYGTEENVQNFNPDNVRHWWAESFDWERVVISVVGNIERNYALDVIDKHFSFRPVVRASDRADVLPGILQRDPIEISESRDKQQTGLVLGFSGITCNDPRFASLEVLRNILSGMGGRLFTNIREKNSLAYTVAAMNISLLRGGAFFCYAGCSPDKEKEVHERLLAELSLARNSNVTDEELRVSKAYTKGSYLMSMQGTSALAYYFTSLQLTNQGLDDWRKFSKDVDEVTQESIRQVANSVINLQKHSIGVVRGKS